MSFTETYPELSEGRRSEFLVRLIYALTMEGRGAYLHGTQNVEGSLRRLAGINEIIQKVVLHLHHELRGTPETGRYPNRTFALIASEVAANYGCLECLEHAANYAVARMKEEPGRGPVWSSEN